MKPVVVHVSTVHPRKDNRILLRECAALADAGYEIHFIVADGLGPETIRGVSIHDAGPKRNRFQRAARLPLRARAIATSLSPSIIHIHDPELLPMALSLRATGYKVIYDAHEDLPRSLMSRDWIPPRVKRIVSRTAEAIENASAARMTAVVGATTVISDRFQHRVRNVETVRNFPKLASVPKPVHNRHERATFCYVGAITQDRGVFEILEAAKLSGSKLLMAGPFGGAEQEAHLRSLPSWKNVEYVGIIPHEAVWSLMHRSAAGLLFLHPVRNYVESLPTKLYEYMAAGIPILASDYPGWPDLVKEEKIGLTCDPLDPNAIAALMRQVIDNPEEAETMGRRGREVVMARYRWENEAEKLVALYRRLVPQTQAPETTGEPRGRPIPT